MKEKLEDLQYDGCLTPLLCFLVLILVVVGIATGFFERVLGVSGESDKVVETVTYRKEDKVHPIYISIEGFLPDDSQGLGFLLKELDSDLPSHNKYTQGGIVVTVTRGYESTTRNSILPPTDMKYLFLYNTETNTYKSVPVRSFEKRSNRKDLEHQLKEKYGSAYDYLHVRYEPDISMTLNYLEGGSVGVVFNEDVKVVNQEEVDKTFKEAPHAE
jgi:hypothetical protein